MAKGTSKIVSLRFVAVTTISSSEVCANAGVMSDAVRTVVTAKMERRDAIDDSPVVNSFEALYGIKSANTIDLWHLQCHYIFPQL